MALIGEQSAILRMPPAPAASSDVYKATRTAVGAGASTAAIAIGAPSSGAYYSFKARGGDISVVFGPDSVSAATANDFVIIAGTSEDWWIGPGVFMRAFGIAAGDLHWARNGG